MITAGRAVYLLISIAALVGVVVVAFSSQA
jgi:hypothetical protein